MTGLVPGRARPAPVRVSRDRWLIAYADMITLLLACFAALYAGAIGRHQSPLVAVASAAPATPAAPAAAAAPTAETIALEAAFAAIAVEAGGDARFELTTDERGVVVTLPEMGAFAIGKADPSDAARRTLIDLAGVLARIPNAIRVEGHTDDAPIQSAEFPSNWELSTARATRVVQLLIEEGQVPPARLSAAGYGPFHPRVANDSPDARALNRRVDIVVLRAKPSDHVEGTRPTADGARQ